MDTAYVYILKFANGKLYVGVSKYPQARLTAHLREGNLVCHAAKKHGTPKLLVVWKGLRDQCYEYEQYLTLFLNTVSPGGYNLKVGGLGGSTPSIETRAKLSVLSKGRKLSSETRAKLSAAHKGKVMSAEACAKMSVAATGRELSAEHRAKISAGGKGRKMSAEHRAKMSAVHKGKVVSAETRAKQSAARKGKKLSKETRQKMSDAHRRRQQKLLQSA